MNQDSKMERILRFVSTVISITSDVDFFVSKIRLKDVGRKKEMTLFVQPSKNKGYKFLDVWQTSSITGHLLTTD